jgi:hypothetical protein
MPPHESARSPEAIAHFKAEVEEKVLSGRDGGLFVLLDTRSRPITRSGIGASIRDTCYGGQIST